MWFCEMGFERLKHIKSVGRILRTHIQYTHTYIHQASSYKLFHFETAN